jgi:hypothetical protein
MARKEDEELYAGMNEGRQNSEKEEKMVGRKEGMEK